MAFNYYMPKSKFSFGSVFTLMVFQKQQFPAYTSAFIAMHGVLNEQTLKNELK